jgi:hypothetical protein
MEEPGVRVDATYVLRAGYWLLLLELLIPPLVLVGWGLGVLVILKGRQGAGLWLLLISSLVASLGGLLWAGLFGR